MYMAKRGASAGPFFIRENSTQLTKSYFTSSVREALMAVVLPYQQFTGHSFRTGAATAAAKAGLEDLTIRALDRWNGAAFLHFYVATHLTLLLHIISCVIIMLTIISQLFAKQSSTTRCLI